MYNIEYVKSVIRDTIENRGLDYIEDETLLDFDSLQFINLIVELEEALNITIDDDYLNLENFSSFTNIENTLLDILENSFEENCSGINETVKERLVNQ